MKWTAGWLILASIVCVQSTALAQAEEGNSSGKEQTTQPTQEQTARAGEHFQRGVDLFRDGDYRAALVEFERADSIAPSYHVQFNIGQVAFELKDYARALRSYRRFLEEGGDAIPPKKREQAQAAVKKLEVRVGELSIATNVVRGEVLVDDTKVAELPVEEPILVSSGRRKVSVLEPGRPALTRFVDVAGGDDATVEILSRDAAADESGAPAQSAPAKDAVMERKKGLPAGFWVSAGVTLGLAAGATTFGILAASAKSSYESQLDGVVEDPGALNEDWETVESRALITDILIGATAAAATVTVIVAVVGRKKTEQPVARVFVSPTGIGLTGAF